MMEGISYIILTLLVVGAWIRTFRLQDQINTLRRQFGIGMSNDVYVASHADNHDGT